MADYKGGYQILDLTGATAGDPVTINGIFNSIENNKGKPILIKANDGQRVFAQAKKSSSNYVLTYLSAEGKTVKVTISNQDAVTTTIEDDSASITALTQGLNEVADRQDANKMLVASRILLDDYNDPSDESKIYTCTSDGYVNFKVAGTIGNNYEVTIYDPGSAGAQAVQARLANAGEYDQFFAVFVKKGMRLVCSSNVGTGNYGYFMPFEN